MKKLVGRNDIQDALQRLDRLTLDEARATGAQTPRGFALSRQQLNIGGSESV